MNRARTPSGNCANECWPPSRDPKHAKTDTLKVAFAGTPGFAATILSGLVSSEHQVGLVISQPDARRGRGRKTIATAVAALARQRDLPLLQPERIAEATEDISRHDALVVAAYGQILRSDTLNAATHGAWNVHASLLPAYRGAAPIERAIMEGEKKTGVTIIRMDEGLDTGPIALQRGLDVPGDMTGGELYEKLAFLGAKAIVDGLALLEDDRLTLTEQDSLNATYAAKLSGEDLRVRWDLDAERIYNMVRALAPSPGARAFHPEVEGPIKIFRSEIAKPGGKYLVAGEIYAANGQILVGCGTGTLEVKELQMPGAKRVGANDFLRGNTLAGAFIS